MPRISGGLFSRCAYVQPGACGGNLWRGESRNLRPGDLRGGRAVIDRRETKAPYRAELMGVHARVALRGVQVLVPEQLLDLAQVSARAQELGGEDVAQRVGVM